MAEEKQLTPEQQDFEIRKNIAIKEMDEALARNQVGFLPVLTGMPYKLQPSFVYTDLKKHETEKKPDTKKDKRK